MDDSLSDGCTNISLFKVAKKMPLGCYSGAVQIDFAEGFARGSAGQSPNRSWRRGYLADGSCARCSSSRKVNTAPLEMIRGAVGFFGLLRLAGRPCMLNEL